MMAKELTPDEVEVSLGKTLRQWRIDAGYSQEELAERASLSRSAVQNLEAGKGARLESLIRVLTALGRRDALDAFAPREVLSPMELLQAQRKAARKNTVAPRVRRRVRGR